VFKQPALAGSPVEHAAGVDGRHGRHARAWSCSPRR
jgi:hypothetical protein